MREIIEKLLALQKLLLDGKPLMPDRNARVAQLREEAPVSMLNHFDRLVARGKRGVAIVRNGACGECHLRLPSGTMAALAYTNEVHLCDNCGRYLYLAEDEPLGLTDSPPPVKAAPKPRIRRIRQKADLHVA